LQRYTEEDTPELAGQNFYPAEEASSTDPLYGGYAAPTQASYVVGLCRLNQVDP
jgi:hypothetical protein